VLQNRGTGGAILTPNELVLPFRGFYVCANFGENRSRNATVLSPKQYIFTMYFNSQSYYSAYFYHFKCALGHTRAIGRLLSQ